jgi:hypothetical protein
MLPIARLFPVTTVVVHLNNACVECTAMLPRKLQTDRQNHYIIFISATVSYRLMSSRTFYSLGKKLDKLRNATILELHN